MEIKIGGKTRFENLLKQSGIPFALVGYEVIKTNSRYALVGYFITSYPTRAHGIVAIYFSRPARGKLLSTVSSCGGSVAEWFRVLDLRSGGPWFKSSTLLLSGFVLGSPELNSSTASCKIANWSASHQLGFLTVYVPFAMFVFLFTVSPISTTVLNTFDT